MISEFLNLEQKTRKSQLFAESQHENNFLTYAQLCQDQEQIYNYMEENKIGIYNVEYWLARLRLAQQQREFGKIQEILKKARKIAQIKNHPNYCLLQKYQKQLQKTLTNMINSVYMKGNNSRSLTQYESLKNKKIDSVRYKKFGDLVVYIDRECRNAYKLESLIKTYQTKCKQQKQFDKNEFQNKKKCKPVSWITKRRMEIIERFENNNEQQYKNRQFDNADHQLQTPKNRIKKLMTIDSKQILKRLQFQPSPRFPKPNFQLTFNNKSFEKNNEQNKATTQKSSIQKKEFPKIEKCRTQYQFNKNMVLFSFEKRNKLLKQSQTLFKFEDGRIQQSQSDISKTGNEDEILKKMITEIQREKYEPEFSFNYSISNIDSNKQNLIKQEIKPFQRNRQKGQALRELKIEDVTFPQILNTISNNIQDSNQNDQQSVKLEELLNQVNRIDDSKEQSLDLGFYKPKTFNQIILYSEKYRRNSNIPELSAQSTNSISQRKMQRQR